MTEHAPDRIWSGIEISKVLAGTLAAVSAAVVGSFLGVAGTLIGAAVASIIGSVGTEVYQRSLDKGAKKIQSRIAPTFVKAPAAVGTPEVAAATDEDSPSHAVPEELKQDPAVTGDRPRRNVRWKPIVIGAMLAFFVAMGAILAVEAVAGGSLASLTGNDDKGGNTLTDLVDSDDGGSDSEPSPSVTPSETTEPSDERSAEPTTDPTSEAPTDMTEPTTEPTTDAPTTEAPPTDAPEQTTPVDPQQNQIQQPEQVTE